MRVIYSVLRELNKKNFIPEGKDYGLKDYEFEGLIRMLENEGVLERVLRINDKLLLKPARLTEKGIELLKEHNDYEQSYPDRKFLKDWVQVEKDLYSNGAEDD